MKKQIVAVVLGLTMVMSALAGCGSKPTDTQESSAAKESSTIKESVPSSEKVEDEEKEITADYFAGEELDIAIVRYADDQSPSFNDKTVVKAVTEATGIKVNFIEIEVGVKEERITTLLAGGDLPDVMIGLFSNDSRVSANKDMFYDLSEEGLLEKWAPDVLETYEIGGQGVMDMLTLSDGSIRSLVTGIGASNEGADYKALWYINKNWLENVGMDVPATKEEFYEVMCAFRDQDANGNGDPNDEIPITFAEVPSANAQLMNLANSFGIAGLASVTDNYYYYLEDGTVKTTLDTEPFRAFLEWANQYAEEGLLDVEGFSQTMDQYKAKLTEDKVGMFIEWNPVGFGLTDADWVGVAPFQALDDVDPVKTGSVNPFIGNLTGFVIAADSDKVEVALHWWNNLSGTLENRMTSRRGMLDKGWHYAVDGSGRGVFANAPNMSAEDVQKYIANDNIGGQGSAYISLADQTYEYNEGNIRHLYYHLYEPMLIRENIPTKLIGEEALSDRSFIEADLFPMISSFVGTSVTEGVTDDSWNKFKTDLETYGYYEWIDWWQNYVDGEF